MPKFLPRPRSALRELWRHEAAGGVLLMLAAAAALILANSPAADFYFGLLKLKLGPLSVLHWINDALMAVFFLLVGKLSESFWTAIWQPGGIGPCPCSRLPAEW